MQIHSLMQPGAFGPEAITAMGDALDAALKELQNIGQSGVQSDVVREAIAYELLELQDLASVTRLACGRRHSLG